MCGEPRHHEEAIAHRGCHVFSRTHQLNGANDVVCQHHWACGILVGVGGHIHALQRVHVPKDAIELSDDKGKPGGIEPDARERSDMTHIRFGNTHLIPSAFEFCLRDDQRLSSNLVIVEVDAHLRIATTAGEFRNRAATEFAVTNALADGERRRVL